MCHVARGGGMRAVRTRLSPASAHAASNASLELHILTRPSPWMPLDAASQRREARLRWNGERAVERSQQRARAARHHFRAGGCGVGSARSDLPGRGGRARRVSDRETRRSRPRGGSGSARRGVRGTHRAAGRDARAGVARRALKCSVAQVVAAILFASGWTNARAGRGGVRMRAAEVRARRGSSERTAGARGRVVGREDARARCGAKAEARDARGSTNGLLSLHRARDREITIDSARLNAHRRKMHPAADS